MICGRNIAVETNVSTDYDLIYISDPHLYDIDGLTRRRLGRNRRQLEYKFGKDILAYWIDVMYQSAQMRQ